MLNLFSCELTKSSGFDFSQVNRWRWRNDYEGINLELCREKWKPLAPWKPVFDFDFNKYMENLNPSAKCDGV